MALGVWLVRRGATVIPLRHATRIKRESRACDTARLGTRLRILLDLLAYFNFDHSRCAVAVGNVVLEYLAAWFANVRSGCVNAPVRFDQGGNHIAEL